jgi:hypothetical protein
MEQAWRNVQDLIGWQAANAPICEEEIEGRAGSAFEKANLASGNSLTVSGQRILPAVRLSINRYPQSDQKRNNGACMHLRSPIVSVSAGGNAYKQLVLTHDSHG